MQYFFGGNWMVPGNTYIIYRNEPMKTFCLAIRSLKTSVKISTTNKSIAIHTIKQ